MAEITPETPADVPEVRKVVTAAFDAPEEAALVDALRDSPAFVPDLSLVARENGSVVGHALFSELGVEGESPGRSSLVLAPVSVAPQAQNRGIGSELVRAGLVRAERLGYDLVFLHGSVAFYSRFGFESAADAGFANPFALPDEDFQVCELTPGALEDLDGELTYPVAFEEL